MNFDWYTESVKVFISDHLHDDVGQLLLNPPRKFRDQIRLIADQLLARQKAKKKLPLWYANPDLVFPPPLSVEQASSAETAAYKASLLSGELLVDLTGGMGVDVLEISQNFIEATYVDRNIAVAATFKYNLNVLRRDLQVLPISAESFLKKYPVKNTAIFLDPARRNNLEKVFQINDCTPNLHDLMPTLMSSNQCLIKLSPFLDITSIIQSLPCIVEIHIVSVKNECKEILVLMTPTAGSLDPKIICVNLPHHSSFTFRIREESEAVSKLGPPEKYLYEPNASIMRAGAFKSIGNAFALKKLNANTHLYTSDIVIINFPGKIFEVIEANVRKSDLLAYAPNHQINVISRNHPSSAIEIKKKFKLKDGGNYFLICFKDLNDKPRMCIAKLV